MVGLPLKLGGLALAVIAASVAGYAASERAWRAKWEQREAEISMERMAWNSRISAAEEKHAAQMQKEREDYNARIRTVNARLGDALERLRQYERGSAEPAPVADGSAGGAGAYQPQQPVLDGEAALRIAAGADETAERLALCQASLRSALRAVEGGDGAP